MTPTLYLHLGAHKTGSTSLQDLLRRNVKALGSQGIAALARPPEIRKDLRRVARGRDSKGEARDRVRAALSKATLGCPSVVLSDEDLIGDKLHPAKRLYPSAGEACRALINLFPNHQPKVIFYTRRQDRFLESCYLQSVNQRRAISFSEFLKHVRTSELAWSAVADALAQVVGQENLLVRAFETIHTDSDAFARCFFETFCDPRGLELELPTANRSLSGLGIDIAMAVAPLVDEQQWKPVRRMLQHNFSTRDQPARQLLSEGQRDALVERYAADTKSVLERYGDSGA